MCEVVYDVPANIIVDSVRRALTGYDVVTSMVKAWVFGTIVSVVGFGCRALREARALSRWRCRASYAAA